MIISHSKKFIFFSNPKTGSESLRALFSPLQEVRVFPYRNRTAGNRFYPHMPPAEARLIFHRFGWDFESYRQVTCIRNPYARLVSLYEMIQSVDRWNRLVCKTPLKTPFSQWVKRVQTKGRGAGGWQHQRWRRFGSWSAKNWAFNDTGEKLVTDIIRLEDLSKALPQLKSDLDMPVGYRVPHMNKGRTQNWRQYYSGQSQEIVARKYAWDIRHFNYSFDIN